MDIENLIKGLRRWNIKSKRLVKALRDLDSLIGMDSAKKSIILQLKALIMRPYIGDIFKNQMLHTVISGPPGVGKTELGKILSRIWDAMGILGEREHPYQDIIDVSRDLSVISKRDRRGDLLYYSRKLSKFAGDKESHGGFKVVSRSDFVAGYVGQTAIKTKKLLDKSRGGVLFIDEAYSLINGEKDTFGMEALTTLNQYMSENPHDIIIIFAGYKDMMDEGIFKSQPGLKSRCSWHINVDGYNSKDLAKIFKLQTDWSLDDVSDFFDKNIDYFPDYGRDTSKLLYYCKLEYINANFNNKTLNKKITKDILYKAFERYKSMIIKKKDKIPEGLYV